MGSINRQRVCKSVITFERTRRYSETDIADFRGTISCRPSNDKTGETLSDWERLGDNNERGLDKTG